MTERDYNDIYKILNEVKEDISNMKVHNANNSTKLDTLTEQVKSTNTNYERLRDIISTGGYGRNSLIEEVKIFHSRTDYLEQRLDTAQKDIRTLESRWIKFLWAMSVAVLLILISQFIASIFIDN